MGRSIGVLGVHQLMAAFRRLSTAENFQRQYMPQVHRTRKFSQPEEPTKADMSFRFRGAPRFDSAVL